MDEIYNYALSQSILMDCVSPLAKESGIYNQVQYRIDVTASLNCFILIRLSLRSEMKKKNKKISVQMNVINSLIFDYR